MYYMCLYNDVNATRAVIGRFPWSIRVQGRVVQSAVQSWVKITQG